VAVFDLHERRYDPLPSQVHFVRGDLNQSYLVREAVTGVDVVFHLIWATIHEVANQDPAGDVTANLIPTIHLLEACRHAGVQRIVFASSGGTVYGPAKAWPIPRRTHKTQSTATASPNWPPKNTFKCLDTYTALTMLFFGPQFRTSLGKTPWLARELWQHSCIE
jgi:nucleoside-diphosphate-sugar epimerase